MADREKGVVPVKVRIREPDRALLPEMSAKVSFLAERADRRRSRCCARCPRAPSSRAAIARVVFTVDENRATRRARVGPRPLGDGFFALDEGPEEGTPLVERPPERLRDGGAVRLAAAT